MPNHSPLPNESITPADPDASTPERYRRRFVRSVKGPAQFVAFWAAITLPFVHLPLLARGLGDPNVLLAFSVLLGVNVLTLYVGHEHNQD
ncbi:hypothetical protein [Natronococcus roseus]|uniref:hypothetical protein n=1 Tax=Natronococcus roseus TaxID=1052014 RepID=UPI00374DEA0B